jgi:hypothetical protein
MDNVQKHNNCINILPNSTKEVDKIYTKLHDYKK